MENQHRKISGYRELTQEEIDLMNEIKKMGTELEALLGKVASHNETMANSGDHTHLLAYSQPGRWLAMAKTEFQKGIMFAVRAVAKPTMF